MTRLPVDGIHPPEPPLCHDAVTTTYPVPTRRPTICPDAR